MNDMMDAVIFREMTAEDIEGVIKVERRSFTNPWSKGMFMEEMNNTCAHYFVASAYGVIVAYAGVWIILDEAHITNIAVDPDYRQKKIATGLLNKIFGFARERKVKSLTLEVREGNSSAISLYKQFGFNVEGKRKGYYSDTKEDALIMWCHLPEL